MEPHNTYLQMQYEEAEAEMARGEYLAVIDRMSALLFEDPNNSVAHTFQAQAFLLLDQYHEAVRAVETALRLDPQHDLNHAIYAFLLAKYNENDQAERFFENALLLNRERSITHYWYAIYWLNNRHQPVRAREHLQIAMEQHPEVADFHLLLGRVYEAERNYAQSGIAFREAVRLNPESFYALNTYGEHLLVHDHDPEEAFDYFRLALKQEPKNGQVLRRFMTCLKARNKALYLFWTYSLQIVNGRKWKWLSVLGLWLGIQVLQILGDAFPAWMPVISPIVLTYVVFCIYTWLVNPVFRFLIKHGLLR